MQLHYHRVQHAIIQKESLLAAIFRASLRSKCLERGKNFQLSAMAKDGDG